MELENSLSLKHEELVEASNAGDSATLMELSKTVSQMENQVEELFEELEIEQTQLDEIIDTYEKKIEELS
jgi:TolA-binding protein